MNSWQCCATHQELSISTALKCVLNVCMNRAACVYRRPVNLVICYLHVLHEHHPKGMCACTHTHKSNCSVLHKQVNQAPTSKSNTRAPPTASASSVPLPLLFRQPSELWENTSRRQLSVYSEQFISTHTIKFQSNLFHWTLLSDGKEANPGRSNKAAAAGLVWPPDTMSAAMRAKH